MIRKLKLPLVFITFILSGCMTAPPYKDEQNQIHSGLNLLENKIPSDKALIEFNTTSDNLATLYEQKGEDLCAPTDRQTLSKSIKARADSDSDEVANVLTFGYHNKKKNSIPYKTYIHVDANKEIKLQADAYSYSSSGTMSSSYFCGPVYLKFTPEDGSHYKIVFNDENNRCGLILTQVNNGSISSIPRHSRWSCTKGFLGVGGGEIIGLREIGGK